MDRPAQLSALQVELAEIFFSLDVTSDFLVAGGAALVASNLVARPTEDLDLFAATPTTSVTAAKDVLARALRKRGCDVVIVQDVPTFCRMIVTRAGEETLVDLAIDSPPQCKPTATILGPTCMFSRNDSAKTPSSSGRKHSTQDSTSMYSPR